jgi:hypothetical protein
MHSHQGAAASRCPVAGMTPQEPQPGEDSVDYLFVVEQCSWSAPTIRLALFGASRGSEGTRSVPATPARSRGRREGRRGHMNNWPALGGVHREDACTIVAEDGCELPGACMVRHGITDQQVPPPDVNIGP